MRRRFLALVMSLLVLASTTLTGVTAFAADNDTADYTVEYYYGGELDSDKTETASAEIGTTITDYIDKTADGWAFDKAEGLPLTVSENAAENIIKVFYAESAPLGSPQSDPVDISGVFSCEVGETVSILSVLGNVADSDRSITYLRVYPAAGESGIIPVVNKNNNEYTYSVGNLSVVAKCGKNDTQKLFTGFDCTPSQAGTQSVYIELVKDGDTIATGTVTLNVPYRVHDDSLTAAPGGGVGVLGNDFITNKAKIVLCDENGADLPAQTAADGSTYYEPAPGLKLSNDGKNIVVLDDSQNGDYTFWYYAAESGKNGQKFYTDDAQIPAKVELHVSNASLYSAQDDTIVAFVNVTGSVNIYENDTLPAGGPADYNIKFYNYSEGNGFGSEMYLTEQDGVLTSSRWGDELTFNKSTGLFEYRRASMGSSNEIFVGYRVFLTDDEYAEAVIKIVNYGLYDGGGWTDYVRDFTRDPIPFGQQSVVDIMDRSDALPPNDYTLSLCNEDGSPFTPPQGVTAELNDQNQLVITPDEPGMTIEPCLKLEWNGNTQIVKMRLQSDYLAVPDEAEAPLGEEVSFNVLDNDMLPALEDVPGAVSRKVVVCKSTRQGADPIEPETDGYCYPDKETETDPNTGDDVTTWSIRVKLDDDGNASATIYRQKKSGFTYAVQYLDDAGNVLASYIGEATIYPVLNYTRQEVVTVPEFSPADSQGYEGDPNSPNNWQVVKGNYYGDDYSVSADNGVVIEKNVAATDTENLFDIILDIRTPVSWSEFLELGTCRLQNGNSDSSSNRVLLYSTMAEAEAIKQFYTDTGSPDTEIVTVQVLFYHDDWQNADNIVHAATKYVVKPSGGNFYLYYQDPIPDHNLHSEKDQSRKIMEGNFYYVDITALYEKYGFVENTIVPDTVTDPMGDMITFKGFVYNPSDSASYADGTLTWDVGTLYNGALEDLIEVTVDGQQVYMHQYNLIYSVELNTAAPDFVSMTPYDTNKQTTFTYEEAGTGKDLDFNIPQVQGRLYGDLTVSKTVSGNDADSTKAFDFTVTLGDTSINGTYGDVSFTNGVATFTLKGGESKTATGLPAGISYKVAEADYSADGYVTTKSGDTGTITDGQTATAAFTNTKNTTPPTPPTDPEVGNLTVSKTISGNAADSTKAFGFTVTLGDTSINGTYGDLSFTNGVATFTLKGGESRTATGLPAGTTFNVAEADYSADGYVTTKNGDTGTITDGQTATAAFTNTKNTTPPTPPTDPKFGNLTISKNVTGDLGDKTKYFTFKVEFNVDGTFSYIGSKSGTITNGGTIQLKHGESITIVDIPAGTSYTVTESGNSGYSVYASGDTGIISDGKTSTAKFTNTRSSVPKTGDHSNMPLWFSLMGISVLGMIGTLFIKTKKRRKAAHLRNK
ncbi:MAG: DUF5979 domain-containing protein [Clostridium sp.]|nr:DUF5979 domain-containing protein [Clostridium sp.]